MTARAAPLLLALLAASCGAPGRGPAETPEGGSCAVAGPVSPLGITLAQDLRKELGRAIDRGAAVVAYDCHGLRVLPECHAPGAYGMLTVKPRRSSVELASPLEISLNVPASPDGKALVAPVTLSLVVAAVLTSSRRSLQRAELEGPCEGATHFLAGVEIGVAGTGGHEPATCWSSEGLPRASEVQQCSGPMRLHLRPFGPAPPTDQERAAPPIDCPAGAVLAGEVCAPPSAAAHHRCHHGDAADCRAQCDGGDAGSCGTLGWMKARDATTPAEARAGLALLVRACDAGDPLACGNAATALASTPGPRPETRVFELFERSCERGDGQGCYAMADALSKDDPKQREIAAVLLSRACQGGVSGGCVDLGARLHAGGDHKAARALFERACDAGDATGCADLGLIYQQGQGAPVNIERARRLFEDACRAGAAVGCADSRAPLPGRPGRRAGLRPRRRAPRLRLRRQDWLRLPRPRPDARQRPRRPARHGRRRPRP